MSEDNKIIFNSTPTHGAYSSDNDAVKRVQVWKVAKERAMLPMSDAFISDTLGKTIKQDKENKLIVFFSMVQNYTFEDQQNTMFSAPSATGKSYIALEVAKYFPKEDVDKKGYTSRRAFFHMNSALETADGHPLQDSRKYVEEKLDEWKEKNPKPSEKITRTKKTRDGEREEIRNPEYSRWKEGHKNEYRRLRDEWDAIDKLYVVNLEKRIIVWKDTPDDQVLQPLRSLISHDEKELIADITDKSTSGGNLTKKVKLIGYPTVIFCQAAFSPDEQERTRFFIISPDMSQEKISKSLNLQAKSLKDRGQFKKMLEEDVDIAALKARIELIKGANIQQIIIQEEDMDALLKWFRENDGKIRDLAPRDQRDFPHLVAMAKGHALFNLPQRDHTPGETLTAKTEDIESAKLICAKIIESNRLGLPPYAYDWWMESLSSLLEAAGEEGLTKTQFSQSYYNRFKTRLSDKSRRRLIATFDEAGFLEERINPGDKRTTKLYALGVGVGNEIKNNLEEESTSYAKNPNLDNYDGKLRVEGASLQGKLEKILGVFATYPDEALREDLVLGLLFDPLGIGADEGRKFLSVLLRNGKIFSPRPGYLKLTGGE